MKTMHRGRLVVAAALVAVAMTACAHGGQEDADTSPAKVEASNGNEPRRVTLTDAAAKRLDVQLGDVSASAAGPGTQMPYGAVLYDPKGDTWAFISVGPLAYVRAPIRVDRIEGDVAFLTNGPPAGTKVVTVGVSELYGAELGVGEGE